MTNIQPKRPLDFYYDFGSPNAFQRFIKEHDLTAFKFNTAFPVNTLLAMRGAIAAQEAGVHDAYFPAVFKATWEDNKDISQPEILASILDEAGLDGSALMAATQDPEIKQSRRTIGPCGRGGYLYRTATV